MKNISVVLLVLFSRLTFAELADDFDKAIRKSGLPKKVLSLKVSDTKGKEIFSLNSKKKFVPASLTKIITAAATLDGFDTHHKFTTKLQSPAVVSNGVLKGDLYLVGGGDPAFVSESFWDLVNEFSRNEISKIEGDLVVDNSLFDDERFAKGRVAQRNARAYDAPVGAMSFNWNSVNIYVRPGALGQPAKVFLDPENEYTVLKNLSKTVKGGKNTIRVERKEKAGKNIFIVRGKFGVTAPEKVIYRSITDPALWSGYNLKSFLQRRGIKVTGKIRRGQVPSSSLTLADKDSKGLFLIVRDMMKFSNNFVAEMLTKNLSVMAQGRPGTMTGGLQALKNFLKKKGLTPTAYQLTSPSGLSRRNKISMDHMVHILDQVDSAFGYFPEFMVSLPISGVDGTLKRRMKPVAGFVRAKTGRLNDALGVAGYLRSRKKDNYIFAFMYNGPYRDLNKAQALHDKLVEVLVK